MLDTIIKYYDDEFMFHGFIPHIMGTQFNILIICPSKKKCDELWVKVSNLLDYLDKKLNRFDPESEVSYLNSLRPSDFVSVSNELNKILDVCRYYYNQTLHLFDITRNDFSKLRQEDQKVLFSVPDISLDFGGIAKGYALKIIKEMLQEDGFDNVFVNFGNSSILGIGHHPYGDCWKIALENPYSNQQTKIFELRNEALSTSGNSPKYTGHILNPLTGIYDFSHHSSSVVSPDPLLAEVLSTVMLIANEEQKTQIIENFKEVEISFYKSSDFAIEADS